MGQPSQTWPSADYTRWWRNRARAALNSSGCSMFDMWPAPLITDQFGAGDIAVHLLAERWRRQSVFVADEDLHRAMDGRQRRRRVGPGHQRGQRAGNRFDRVPRNLAPQVFDDLRPVRRVVSPTSFGSSASATAACPLSRTSCCRFLRPAHSFRGVARATSYRPGPSRESSCGAWRNIENAT